MIGQHIVAADEIWSILTPEPDTDRRHVVPFRTQPGRQGSVAELLAIPAGHVVIAAAPIGLRRMFTSPGLFRRSPSVADITADVRLSRASVVSTFLVWFDSGSLRLLIEVGSPSPSSWAQHLNLIVGSKRSLRGVIGRLVLRLVGPRLLADAVVVVAVKG